MRGEELTRVPREGHQELAKTSLRRPQKLSSHLLRYIENIRYSRSFIDHNQELTTVKGFQNQIKLVIIR